MARQVVTERRGTSRKDLNFFLNSEIFQWIFKYVPDSIKEAIQNNVGAWNISDVARGLKDCVEIWHNAQGSPWYMQIASQMAMGLKISEIVTSRTSKIHRFAKNYNYDTISCVSGVALLEILYCYHNSTLIASDYDSCLIKFNVQNVPCWFITDHEAAYNYGPIYDPAQKAIFQQIYGGLIWEHFGNEIAVRSSQDKYEEIHFAFESTKNEENDYVGNVNIQGLADMLAKFAKVKQPRSLLFYGPPGTGKTTISRLIAACAKGRILRFCMNDLETWIYWKFSELVDLLKPDLILFDDIDRIFDEKGLAKLLSAFESIRTGMVDGTILIGTTNRPEELDVAITRAGRFDMHIQCPLPDKKERNAILEHYLKKYKVDQLVNWIPENQTRLEFLEQLSEKTEGFSGADLKELMIRAYVQLDQQDYSWAKLITDLQQQLSTQKSKFAVANLPNGFFSNPESDD